MPNLTVGAELADAVAARLEAGNKLCHNHPEYCGMGLHYADGAFIYCEVYDGDMPDVQQYQRWKARGGEGEFLVFSSRAEFSAWLAAQSDESLSGRDLPREWLRGNQRLTVERLRAFTA